MIKNKDSEIIDCTTYSNEICNDNYINDQLSLEINDVDDLAIVWISYPKTTESDLIPFVRIEEGEDGNVIPLQDTQWLWRSGGRHGSGTINITQWLHNNWEKYSIDTNRELYLIIAIYDFPYGASILKGGKWSFDARLVLNGQVKWSNYNFGKSDTINNSYGLKYLKVFKFNIEDKKDIPSQTVTGDKVLSKISESINKDILNYIHKNINENYYYTKQEDLKETKVSKAQDSDNAQTKRKTWKQYLYDTGLLFIIGLSTYYFYSYEVFILAFVLSNILILLYIFIRFKVGGIAWELVLRKKHAKELDIFMIILGLLFTAALSGITSFDFDSENLKNSILYQSIIFSLYTSTNIVFLYILTIIGAYAVNTIKANKRLVLTLIILIGFGIFIQEVINIEQNYKDTIYTVKIENEGIHEIKK